MAMIIILLKSFVHRTLKKEMKHLKLTIMTRNCFVKTANQILLNLYR